MTLSTQMVMLRTRLLVSRAVKLTWQTVKISRQRASPSGTTVLTCLSEGCSGLTEAARIHLRLSEYAMSAIRLSGSALSSDPG